MNIFNILLFWIITSIMYIIIYTPKWISNLLWTVYIRRSYTIENKPGFYTFLYNHSHADGMLTEHILKHCDLPKYSKIPHASCSLWTHIVVPDGLYPSHTTSFQRLCAFIVKKYMHKKKCTTTSVGIVVGMRTFIPLHKRWCRGCFVRYARYHVSNEHTLAQICNLQHNAIQNIYKDGTVNQAIIEKTDHFADLKFNKWMLNTIQRADGITINLHRGGKEMDLNYIFMNKNIFKDFKCIKKNSNEWLLMV